MEVLPYGNIPALAAGKQAFRRLRLECAYRGSGILPDEERVLADSTISVIRTDNTPSGNTPLRKAQMESDRTHVGKKIKESHKDSLLQCGGIRLWRRYLLTTPDKRACRSPQGICELLCAKRKWSQIEHT